MGKGTLSNNKKKIFISFLGLSNYTPCTYIKKVNEEVVFETNEPVRFVQEATLDYLERDKKWSADDVALILLTSGAKTANWENNIRIDEQGNEVTIVGLQDRLLARESCIQIETIEDIKLAENEEDLWSIFTRIVEVIQSKYQGRDLYFDMTHSFRYLPMFFMVLSNYLKFVCDIEIKEITYGAFEARNKQCNKAPLIDLLPLSQLQDWTYAAANYLKNGYADDLHKLAGTILKADKKKVFISGGNTGSVKNMNDYLDAIHAYSLACCNCRGNEIFQGDIFTTLRDCEKKIDYAEYTIPALEPIMEKISSSIKFLSGRDARNIIEAASWCSEHNKNQQAATLLQEGIVTFLCDRYALNPIYENDRNCVNIAFGLIYRFQQEPEKRAKGKKTELALLEKVSMDCLTAHIEELCPELKNNKTCINGKTQKEIVLSLLGLPIIDKLCSVFQSCTNLRNDFNHAGFRNGPSKVRTLEDSTKKNIKYSKEYLTENLINQNHSIHAYEKIFIDVSHHDCKDWIGLQKDEIQKYDTVKHLEFPDVNPCATKKEILDLVNFYLTEIVKLSNNEPCTVHIMGEMTFTYAMVNALKISGYKCVASTTKRIVEELPDGVKNVKFEFCQFREY